MHERHCPHEENKEVRVISHHNMKGLLAHDGLDRRRDRAKVEHIPIPGTSAQDDTVAESRVVFGVKRRILATALEVGTTEQNNSLSR